jgi:hypothetical protein
MQSHDRKKDAPTDKTDLAVGHEFICSFFYPVLEALQSIYSDSFIDRSEH